jgi:DNA polymerase-3 subunit gamma/tau
MSAPIPISSASLQPIPETRGAPAIATASRPALETLPMPVPAPVLLPESMPLTAPSCIEERIEQQPDVLLPEPVFTTAASAVPPVHSAPAGAAPNLQHSVVEALTAATQTSAAEALADAVWTLTGGEAIIQTTLSKTMLPAIFKPDAETIARAVLRDAGILKLTLLPVVAPPAKKPRPARTGSVQARALEHPMVQQAQKLFSAEIQTVIDLREPD